MSSILSAGLTTVREDTFRRGGKRVEARNAFAPQSMGAAPLFFFLSLSLSTSSLLRLLRAFSLSNSLARSLALTLSLTLSRPISLSLFLFRCSRKRGKKQQNDKKKPFTAPSAAFWCLLSAATVVEYHRTKQLSAITRGASVRRGIRWVVGMYALDSILLLILSLLDAASSSSSRSSSKFPDAVDFASLLLEDFAEAAFLLLLLAVAAGVGIARAGPGPHRAKVLLVPLVYLVTTLAVDLAEVRKEKRKRREFFAARPLCRRRRRKKK